MENNNDSRDIIEIRKERIINFFRKSQYWIYCLLIIALILGVYIRILPMTDHGGNPGLWDVTLNSWTLGPDLDPWLFMRQAKSLIAGEYPAIDNMRNVPLGFDNSKETVLLPYMIYLTYKITKIFYTDATPEYAGVIFPVIMFALTILAFFFFVREIFLEKDQRIKLRANIIAIISTFLMIVLPVFLPRTIAGIPEKESAAFFFMFLSFYLFLKAFKDEDFKRSIIFAVLSGISTAIMGLIWGGVMYVYISLALAYLVAFIFKKMGYREFLIYVLWYWLSVVIYLIFSNRETLDSILTSLSSGLAFFVMIIILFDKIFWRIKYIDKKFGDSKIPKEIISLFFAILFILILSTIFFGSDFVLDKIKAVHQTIFRPVQGRWNTTVAENRQPYLTEWRSSFGPYLKSIPLLFTLFFIGSIILFYNLFRDFHKNDKIILTVAYFILLSAMIFSRYSDSGILNGDNLFSRFVYYLGALFFFFISFKIYIKYSKSDNTKLKSINFSYLFLIILFLLGVFSSRGAIRLIIVLAPISTIFSSYLITETIKKYQDSEKNKKMIFGIILIIICTLSIFMFISFYNEIKISSYNMIPSAYNQQWQKAMDWIRKNTMDDSVFASWWDYGYWIQSIGERATVLDGGNAITFWNYYMGRLVLTGDNQDDALEFLYNHNTTHFLIDSSDIGKYSAFSSIGSNESYDRFSWIGVMLMDESKISNLNNQTTYIYNLGISLDEDILLNENGNNILLPAGKAVVAGGILSFKSGDMNSIEPPYLILIYAGKQYKVLVRYLTVDGNLVDFKEGIEANFFVFPSIINSAEGQSINNMGAIMYLSPRLMRGMLAQKYILDDPFNNFQNFKLVHTESSYITSVLRSQGVNVPEFVYYQGVQGPIKIWGINYTGKEEIREDYIDKDSSKYLSWKL